MKPKSTLRSFLLLAGSTLLAASSAHAGQIWDGGGADNNWNTAANWDSNALPTFTNAITFTGNTRNSPSNNLAADSTIGGINLTNTGATGLTNAFTLSGARITLGGGITTTANTAGSTITDTISLDMILNAPRTMTTNQQSAIVQHNLTISGIISQDASTRSLTKAGGGVLTLTGANSYTGTTTISGGTLDLGGSTANGSLTSATLTLSGGAFTYTRTGGTTQGFTTTNINGGGSSQISVVSGNTLNLGTVARGTGATFNFANAGAGTVSALAASNDVTGIMAGFALGDSWAVANGDNLAISGLVGASYTLSSVASTSAAAYTGNIDVDSSPGTLDGPITTNSLRFSSGAANTLTLTGTTNTLTSGGILVGSGVVANLSTITGGTLAGANTKDLVVIQNNTSGGLTISSVIGNNTGATALTKSGVGLLTLDNSNTFTGGVFIHAGKIALANAGALNSTTPNNVTFGTGSTGTLSLSGNSLTIPILNTDANIAGTALIENASASDVTLTINSASNSSFGGVIQNGTGTGKLALAKSSAGTLTLSGANTYTGDTTISAGVVNINNATSFGASKVLITGTSRINTTQGNGVNIAFANAIDVGGALTLQNPQSATGATSTFSGQLTGSNSITLAGGGGNGLKAEFAFTNTNNTFTGDVALASGNTVGYDQFSFNSIGDNGKFTLQKSGNQCMIAYTGSSNIAFGTRIINVGAINGTFDGGGTNPVNMFANNGSGTVTFNTNMTVAATLGVTTPTLFFGGSNTGNNTFAGNIPNAATSGNLGIGKTNAGKWILTGSNSFAGEVLIRDGIMSVNAIDVAANNQPLGKNSVIQIGHLGNTGTLEFTGGTNSTTDKQVRVGNSNSNSGNAGGATILNNGNGSLTFSNSAFNPTVATVTATRTLTLGGTYTGTNEIQGVIQDNVLNTGKVAVTKTGAGIWKLSNANTYNGNTTISAGVLLANNANAIPGGLAAASTGSAISLNGNGAILGLGAGDFFRAPNGLTPAVGKIAFVDNGGFAAYGADRVVNFGGTDTITPGGIVAIGSTTTTNIGSLNGKVLHLGSATATHKVTVMNTLDFGNASRTIQVNDGAAAVDAEISGVLQPQVGGTAGFTKTGSGTLVLSANNTYNGGTTVSDGTLTINGSVADATMSISAGATVNCTATGILKFNVDGITADQVINNGIINLNGLTVAVNATGLGLTQPEYVLVDATGGGAISGTFTGVTGAPGYTLNYATANQVKLVASGVSGFAAWQAANSTGGGLGDDHDNDGVDNGTEYFLGGTNDTTGFTPLPAITNTGGILSVTWARHPDYPGFPGNYGTDFVVETSTTLTGPWTPESSPGTVSITGNDVTYTFPGGPAYSGKNFARLKVTGP